MRRDLELFPARLAGHLVVKTQQVIAKLVELGAILAARRLPVLAFGAAHPADAVFTGPLAARTGVLRRPVLGFVLEIRFFVESHERILSFIRTFGQTFDGRSDGRSGLLARPKVGPQSRDDTVASGGELHQYDRVNLGNVASFGAVSNAILGFQKGTLGD